MTNWTPRSNPSSSWNEPSGPNSSTWTNQRPGPSGMAFHERPDGFQEIVEIGSQPGLLGFSIRVDEFLSLDLPFNNPLALLPVELEASFISLEFSDNPFNTIWTRLNPQ